MGDSSSIARPPQSHCGHRVHTCVPARRTPSRTSASSIERSCRSRITHWPSTITSRRSSGSAEYTMLRMGYLIGVMETESVLQKRRSALAPGAMRPRSSRWSARAAATVAESNTWRAVDVSPERDATLPSVAVQRRASSMDWGAVSVPRHTLTPAAR